MAAVEDGARRPGHPRAGADAGRPATSGHGRVGTAAGAASRPCGWPWVAAAIAVVARRARCSHALSSAGQPATTTDASGTPSASPSAPSSSAVDHATKTAEPTRHPEAPADRQREQGRLRRTARRSDASKDCEALGLKVEQQTVDNPGDEQEDTVADVNPTGDVRKGSTVTLSVYGKPQPTEPPTTASPPPPTATAGPATATATAAVTEVSAVASAASTAVTTVSTVRVGGRYELGELLGRGGMAEVRKGTDVRLGRVVAVKRLRTDLASDPTFQARFRREAQSSASLNHPAIVSVYDTGEERATDGSDVPQPYIVMEYVAGRTLREILREGRKILPERALEITSGVLAALDYSHRAGIVHRDIKPANVMLTPSGDVKVMDFGIARAIADASSTMTQTAAVVGTAQYLSPEQARGETVDSRSDVYSTGCLLYELLTGRPPFVGESPVSVAYQHVREQAPPPSTLDPELSPEIDAIVMKSLTKDVEQRYQSASAMRADIERCLAGQAGGGARRTRRHRRAPLRRGRRPRSSRGMPDDEERERKRRWPMILTVIGIVALLVLAAILGQLLFNSSPEEKTVPQLVNMTQQQAESRIKQVGLSLGQVSKEASEDVPEGPGDRPGPGRDEPAGTRWSRSTSRCRPASRTSWSPT